MRYVEAGFYPPGQGALSIPPPAVVAPTLMAAASTNVKSLPIPVAFSPQLDALRKAQEELKVR